jgi:nucleoside-diphosphate-sugar epimerase
MSSVFLTGGTGYAGSYVRAELLRRNIPVTALVRKPSGLEGCRTVVGELATLGGLADEIAQADAILHLGCTRTQACDPVLKDDIAGTALLIDAWRSGPFVFSSSPTVYGWPRGTLAESTPTEIYSWYDLGKVANELQLRLAESSNGRGPAIRLRPGLVFATGERCYAEQYLGFFYLHCQLGSKFLFDSEEGLETYGSSFIGGTDFGRAVADSIAIKVAGAYNVAGGFCTWRALLETMNRYAGTRADFLIRPGAQPGPGECRPPQSRTFLDVTAFAAQTGFAAKQSVEELVQEFVQTEHTTVRCITGKKTSR